MNLKLRWRALRLARKYRTLKNEIFGALIVLGGIFIAETAIAQPFIVPSGSMEPTLQIGDELLASKFVYGYSKYSLPIGSLPGGASRIFGARPQRGDVVVFRLPHDPSQAWVKRVIGLPGERVQMRAGELYINDKLVPRTLVHKAIAQSKNFFSDVTEYSEMLPGGRAHAIYKISDALALNDTPVFTVPAGHYFVMGDNRDNSADSRLAPQDGGVGFLPMTNLVGRAEVVAYSIHPLTGWGDIFSRPLALRLSRVLTKVN
jgi:signal peptidase I